MRTLNIHVERDENAALARMNAGFVRASKTDSTRASSGALNRLLRRFGS